MQCNSAIATALVFAAGGLSAAETPPLEKTGLNNIQMVTEVNEVQPGETLTVGLLIEPKPGFHTYWKGPGVVGVATDIEWTLPEGFEAGPILWPPPEKTLMAGIGANGYRSEQILLTDIVVPKEIKSDQVTIKTKVAWMACSTSCHPGIEEFTLTLPVNRSDTEPTVDKTMAEAFDTVRQSIPPSAPNPWSYSLSLPKADTIKLTIAIPETKGFDTSEIQFFSYDHQVDSDAPQQVDLDERDRLVLRLPRPTFAPPRPASLSGLLFSAKGWPGTESKWVEISVPWPEGTFNDE